MSEVFNRAIGLAKEVFDDASESPLTVMRKLGLNVPKPEDLSKSIITVAETISPAADIKEMVEGSKKTSEGNILSGLAQMAGGMAGVVIPGSAKIRSAGKEIDKGLSSILESEKKLDDYGKAWKANPANKVSKRQVQDPLVKQAAKDLESGEIKGKQFRDTVKQSLPIKPIDKIVDVPTFEEIVGALDKNKVQIGIIGLNKNIPEGTRLATRLDIPAYNRYGKWIVSVHESGTVGKSIGYGKTARLKNIVFGTPAKDKPKKALKIAQGGNKSPFARIEGNWTNAPDEDTASFAERLLKNKKDGKYIDDAGEEWVQVGMNPYRGSYFYDKATGQALQKADELIQVGPLVFAKGSRKPTLSEYKKGFTTETDIGSIVAFKEGGQIMPMQYGGGLDDAYMTFRDRKRRSAFADPNATSAFANGGLPTVYRENGGFMDDADAQAYADVYGPADPGNVDPGTVDPNEDVWQAPPTSRGDTWRPKSVEQINKELAAKERDNMLNSAAITQLWRGQERGSTGTTQRPSGTSSWIGPTNNRSYNFDFGFTPSLPAASNPPPTPIEDSSPKIDENLLDKKLGDLSRPDFSRVWRNITNPMTGIQSNKFDRGGPNLDNTVREAIAAAKEILDGPVSTRKTGGGLPTVYRFTGGLGLSFGDDQQEAAGDTYNQDQLDQLSQAYGPSPQLSDLAADSELGYNAPEIAAIRDAQRAAAEKDEADRRIGYLKGTTRTVTDQRTSIPTKEEYERSLDKYGYEPWQTAYLNDLIRDGYDINQAQSTLASAMATPGGIQGMRDAFYGGYSYGGPAGTLQDLLEKGTGIGLGLGEWFKNRKKPKEREGLKGLIDKGFDMASVTRNMTPENIDRLNNMLIEKGASFTPNNKFASAIVGTVAPLAAKAAISYFGGEKTVGTLTTRDGLSYQVGDRGGLTLNTPDVNIDYGSDIEVEDIQEEVITPEQKKEEEKKRFDLLLGKIGKKEDPNVKILMDTYGLTREEALEWLGTKTSGEEEISVGIEEQLT
jgi:hypothetical protein